MSMGKVCQKGKHVMTNIELILFIISSVCLVHLKHRTNSSKDNITK